MSEEKIAESKRCKKCGFKKRGKNHDEGQHHKKGKKGRYNPKGR